MAYVVSLKQFEGPLDLLLHLITRAKVDIKDIFVSEITEQYLASLDGLDELDMDVASEFLTMAATLLEIKSRALLPRPPKEEDEDEESPEQALIRRLEEYKLYKESAGRMKEFEKVAMQVFSKLPEEYPLPPQPVELTGLSLEGLVRALERIIARQTQEADPGRVFRSITRDKFTIEQCTYNLTARLKKGPVLFTEMLSSDVTRDEIVSYFMAMLELLKMGRLHAQQEKAFDDILILPGRRDGEDGEEEEIRFASIKQAEEKENKSIQILSLKEALKLLNLTMEDLNKVDHINGKLYAERKERKKKKGKIQTYIDKTNNPTTIGDILKAKGITI